MSVHHVQLGREAVSGKPNHDKPACRYVTRKLKDAVPMPCSQECNAVQW